MTKVVSVYKKEHTLGTTRLGCLEISYWSNRKAKGGGTEDP